MPVYQYTAVDAAGRTLRGQLEAASEAALEKLLGRQGHWLADVSEQSVVVAATARVRGNAAVPRRVLVEFFLQLGLQLRAGVPIMEALRFGLEDPGHLGFAEVQRDVLERIQAGSPLSEAMSSHPRTFAPLVINLIRTGEAGGRLPETCAEIRAYYEWNERLASDVRQALLYPLFVLVITVVFFLGVFTFLIPKFAGVLHEMNVPLPWITRLFLGISEWMTRDGWVLIPVLVLAVLSLKWGPRLSPAFARWLDLAKLAIPVFGRLIHLVSLSRLAQNLSTLYRAGIPLLNALQLSRGLVGNRVLEEAIGEVRAGVNAGHPMHEIMRQHPVFSQLIVQMVAVGERSGTLGESLQHVADYYNEIVPRQVKRLFTVLEPVMILGLIFLVGLVALAIFLPIASALSAR